MIHQIAHIDLDRVKGAVLLLTGIAPVLTISDNKMSLRLGNKSPLEMGFDVSRKDLTEEGMIFSLHIALLRELAILMQNEAEFLIWLSIETDFISQNN